MPAENIPDKRSPIEGAIAFMAATLAKSGIALTILDASAIDGIFKPLSADGSLAKFEIAALTIGSGVNPDGNEPP
jgi:hypothetical protein